MPKTLYLIETRAARSYACTGCGRRVQKGHQHFRHDPHPYARMYRGEPTTHWCFACVLAVESVKELSTGRIRVPIVRVLEAAGRTQGVALAQVQLIGIGSQLSSLLEKDPKLVYRLTPRQFQTFVCDRIDAMGYEPKEVGDTYRKDGGIDILFWPKVRSPLPLLGAVQTKHHQNPRSKEGPASVRDFAGVVAGHPLNVGILVTNTSFTPDAEWFAKHKARLLRLRGFEDIKRWVGGNFDDDAEWRELPESIEVCPGVVVPISPAALNKD